MLHRPPPRPLIHKQYLPRIFILTKDIIAITTF